MQVRSVAAVFWLLASAGTAQAQTFNNEAQWQAAAGSFKVEDFESFPNLTQVTQLPSVLLYMNRLNTGNAAPTVMATSTTGGTSASGSNVLVNQSQPVLPGLGPIRFFSTVKGLTIRGMGYWNTGGDDSTVLRFYDPQGNLIASSDTGTTAQVFNGILTAQPVGWVEIDAGSIGNGYITLDDLHVAIGPMLDGTTANGFDPWGLVSSQSSTSSTGAVHWDAPAGALGTVHAVPGAPPTPGGWTAAAFHPQSSQVGIVQADAAGQASFTAAPGILSEGGTWTLQVLWLVPDASSSFGVRLVPGDPRTLNLD